MLKYIIFLSLSLFPFYSKSQELAGILSQQICECIEKKKITNIVEADTCFNKVFADNLEYIYSYHEAKTMDEVDTDKLAAEITAKLTKNCNYMLTHFAHPSNKFEEGFIPDSNLKCSDLHAGEFYYLVPNPRNKSIDTTFVTIKDGIYLEKIESGKKYSLLDINWITECQFELTFKESNDPYKSALSQKGDKYNYEVVSSSPKSFIIRLDFNNQSYKFELFYIE